MASVHYHLKLNAVKDRIIIDRINAQDNKNNYIRRLVLSDIAADGLRPLLHLTDQEEDHPDPDEH